MSHATSAAERFVMSIPSGFRTAARFMSTSKTVLLTSSERAEALKSLGKWTANKEQTTISRALKFKSFSEAWGFMSRVALRAEKLNHHPEWKNVDQQLRSVTDMRYIIVSISHSQHILWMVYRRKMSLWRNSLTQYRQRLKPQRTRIVAVDTHSQNCHRAWYIDILGRQNSRLEKDLFKTKVYWICRSIPCLQNPIKPELAGYYYYQQ